MFRHIDDIKPVESSKGIFERVLLAPEDTEHHNLTVKHFALTNGTTVNFPDQDREYQHYVVSGCALMGGAYVHSESAIFVPGNKSPHKISQAGETELRLVTHIYKAPKPYFRWAKARTFHLYNTAVHKPPTSGDWSTTHYRGTACSQWSLPYACT